MSKIKGAIYIAAGIVGSIVGYIGATTTTALVDCSIQAVRDKKNTTSSEPESKEES